LKQFQQACLRNEASSARKDLAQWARNYAPQSMRGSMRDFGAACGDRALQQNIAELDASGFTGEGSITWQGGTLWAVFKDWQNRASRSRKSEVGDSPDLYG